MNKTSYDRLHRIFTDSFSVSDIAEPLASFDGTRPVADVHAVMDEHGYETVGIREEGKICGYLRRDAASDGTCSEVTVPFEHVDIVSDTDCLPSLVGRLVERRRLFVTSFGEVGGIVSRSDLQKPPVRMWLFGVVTIIEMGFTRLIEQRFSDDGWKQYVSESRLQKAEVLLTERRRRRDQELSLLDCLQFSDKGQIALRDDQLNAQVGFQSRRRGTETIKQIEALRNNLAHSQDIVTADWETIVALSENLDVVLSL